MFLPRRSGVAAAGDALFLVSGKRTVSRGALAANIDATRRLFVQTGLGPGDAVLVAVADELVALPLLLAGFDLGLTLLIVNPSLPAAEARPLIDFAQPIALVMDEPLLAAWGLSGSPVPTKGGFLVRGHEIVAARGPQAISTSPGTLGPAYVLFTSGSSGKPKGVAISYPALATHLETLACQFGYGPDSRQLNPLPWHHADGLVGGPLLAWYSGATLVRPAQFDFQAIVPLLDLLGPHRITHLVAVPTMLAILERLGAGRRDAFATPWFTTLISTGGHLEERLWRSVEAMFGVEVCNIYGLTETVVGGVFSGPGPTRRVGSLGRPVDCITQVVATSGALAAPGEPGELWMRGSAVMDGYWRSPGEMEAVLADGWLRTGDLVSVDAEGFHYFHGRLKTVLNKGGLLIVPEQVVAVLKSHPAVHDAVVVGRPDPVWEEVPVAVIEPVGAAPPSVAELANFCRARLADYKVPHAFHLRESLPRGPAGKVLLPELRAWLACQAEQATDLHPTEATTGTVEAQVLALAAHIFILPPTMLSLESGDHNTPGWDSLAFMDLLMALEERFFLVFEVEEILSIHRLADAVALVRAKSGMSQ